MGYPDAYYATRWTDVSTDGFGYTLIAPHGVFNGYNYKPKEQAIELALLRVRPMPKQGMATVHPSIQGTGHHHWRCALTPHPGTWREAASHRDAQEFHTPLLAFSPTLGAGQAGLQNAPPDASTQRQDSASFAEVQPANVVLSALRPVTPEKDGQPAQYELRLYETMGNPADVVVRLGCPVKGVVQTNFLGEPPSDTVGKIDVTGGEIRFHIRPWKIVTLRVTRSANGIGT
jgi:alpha-mannosidase